MGGKKKKKNAKSGKGQRPASDQSKSASHDEVQGSEDAGGHRTEGHVYKKAICKAWTKLLEDMDPVSLLDRFTEQAFFTQVTIRDLREIQTTSEKNRKILENVLMKVPQKYELFKRCLTDSDQKHLVDLLLDKESEVAAEQVHEEDLGASAISPESSQDSDHDESTITKAQCVTQTIHAKYVNVGDHNQMTVIASPGGISGTEGRSFKDTDPEQEHIKGERMEHGVQKTNEMKQTQNITAKVVNVSNTFIQQMQVPRSDGAEAKTQEPLDSSMKLFLEAVGDFKKGHYILLAGETSHVKYLEAVSVIPWLAVFDFDPESREKGLLSYVEESIQKRRSLHINSWQDKCTINEDSTNWIFAQGLNGRADSLVERDFKTWKSRTEKDMKQHIKQLQRFCDAYTPITVVVYCPKDSGISHHLHKLIDYMDDLNPKIVLPTSSEDKGTHRLHEILSVFPHIGVVPVTIETEHFCKALYHIGPMDQCQDGEYKLPTSDRTLNAGISHKQARYLQEDLEVLYIDNKTGVEYNLDQLNKEADTFWKGGTLPWTFWYATGPGHLDIERDISQQIKEHITDNHIEIGRSGLITLCHAPGSGGTTLAQRILWDLHNKTPCVQVKHNQMSSPNDIAAKIELLSDKTKLPIIVFMDREDELKVECVQKLLRDSCVIILYTKRDTLIKKAWKKRFGMKEMTFWLSPDVSKKEANSLASKYGTHVSKSRSKQNIEQLAQDVSNGNARMIFDFGLAAHSYEYRGLKSYVTGFLKLEERSSLQPWHKALGFLSLANYYGQMGMPCYFFSDILDKMTLIVADFPEEMQEFIVRNHHDARKNVACISHYFVAKEILDQLLSGPSHIKSEPLPTILRETKKNMSSFAIEFIKYTEKVVKDTSSISKIYTNIFISRDSRRIGEREPDIMNSKKRSKVSQICEDVSPEPPFTERFDIFNQLVESFPADPLLRAHLGRLYVTCRPDKAKAAEECFQKALDICEQNNDSLSEVSLNFNMKQSLRQIYHMFGSMYLQRSQSKENTSRSECRKADAVQFKTIASELLEMIKKACGYFEKCREITPQGQEESYGYIGEIQARMLFCRFVNSHSPESFRRPAGWTTTTDKSFIEEFIDESFVRVDELFIECFSVTEPGKMEDTIKECQEQYAYLFFTQKPGHIRFSTDRSNSSTGRRHQIAIRKGMYTNKDNTYVGLEQVTETGDIVFIVKQYEMNIDEDFQNEKCLLYSKRSLDIDCKEWMYAIRSIHFPENYSVEKVLQYVQRWYDNLKTPFSRFYLFALKSILGFGSDAHDVNPDMLRQAQELKYEMLKYKKYMAKPKYPHEWLGSNTNGIRRLASGNRFFGRTEVAKDKGACNPKSLEIVKGTILPPNDKPAKGFIEMDMGVGYHVPVMAFFLPVRCDMKGENFVQARVECSIAFTMSHGYDAFNVKALQKLKCRGCGNENVEIRSCDKTAECRRCKAMNMRPRT